MPYEHLTLSELARDLAQAIEAQVNYTIDARDERQDVARLIAIVQRRGVQWVREQVAAME